MKTLLGVLLLGCSVNLAKSQEPNSNSNSLEGVVKLTRKIPNYNQHCRIRNHKLNLQIDSAGTVNMMTFSSIDGRMTWPANFNPSSPIIFPIGDTVGYDDLKFDHSSLYEGRVTKYNEQGDLVFDSIPSLVGREDELLIIWEQRIGPVQRYEYRYDRNGFWTKKYLIFPKKMLLEKRRYKYSAVTKF